MIAPDGDERFDVIVVAGDLSRVGQMSCNAAVGGVARGAVAREVDALGGVTGRAADRTCLHSRMLNRSRGSAVRAPRAQCDRGRTRAPSAPCWSGARGWPCTRGW